MPQSDKSSYTDKQKRQAGHIEAGYEKKGLSAEDAAARAWATVNKVSGGAKRAAPVERFARDIGIAFPDGRTSRDMNFEGRHAGTMAPPTAAPVSA